MIYTITLNPALDYIIKLKELVPNEINTSESEYILPGGKGINVSIILKRLEVESVALGFISSFTGKEIQKLVEKEKVQTDFINLEEGHYGKMNRKCIKVAKTNNYKGLCITNQFSVIFIISLLFVNYTILSIYNDILMVLNDNAF